MSIHISVDVWKFSQHKGSHLLVMLALADQANEEGWCYPAKNTIARRCRLSKRQTDKIITDLVLSGELVIFHRRDGQRNKTNVYQFAIKPPVAYDSTPLSPTTVPPRHPRQYPPVAHDSTLLSPTTSESSFNHYFNRESESLPADAEEHPDPLDELFKSTKSAYRKDKSE